MEAQQQYVINSSPNYHESPEDPSCSMGSVQVSSVTVGDGNGNQELVSGRAAAAADDNNNNTEKPDNNNNVVDNNINNIHTNHDDYGHNEMQSPILQMEDSPLPLAAVMRRPRSDGSRPPVDASASFNTGPATEKTNKQIIIISYH